jgi:hypothetical protein
MLIFIDAPKFYRVLRMERSTDGAVKRTRVGRLMKADYEFRLDEGFSLGNEEQAQIDNLVETLRSADLTALRVDALRFPEVARRAVEYYVSHATAIEKQLIATAALEVTRAVRKVSKQEQEAD